MEIDLAFLAFPGEAAPEFADPAQIFFAKSAGVHWQFLFRFDIFEETFTLEVEIKLLGGQKVEDNDFLAVMLQAAEQVEDGFLARKKVGDDNSQAAPIESIDDIGQAIAECEASAGSSACESLKQIVQMARTASSRQGVRAGVTEECESGSIVLADHEISQGGSEKAAIMKFVRLAEIHRGAGIEQNLAVEIGVVFKLLDVEFVGAAPDFPIDMTEIVPLHVRAVSGEFGAVTQERTMMQAAQETLHDIAGDQ
jgi:hypothetical protein